MNAAFLGMALVLQTGAIAEKGQASRPGVPMDAVALALEDIAQAGQHAASWRYVWIPSGGKDESAAVDVAVNAAISRSPSPVKGVRLGGNHLLRYDLRILAPKEADLKKLTDLWEGFQKDEPYFLVNGIDAQAVVIITEEARIHTPKETIGTAKIGEKLPYLGEMTDANNSWFRIRFQGQEAFVLQSKAKKELGDVKARVMGPHVGQEASELVLATHSQVPIVRHDYFLRKVLSTLDGGLYYEFRGIEKSPDKAKADIEHFLETFAGVTETDIAKLRSDQKVAMFRSNVTGKPRAVVLFTGAQGRISVNQGLVAITQDMADADVDPLADPVLNLLKHKFAGIELFLEMQNGQIAYALFTGDVNGDGDYDPEANEGQLVRSVPDNIATDSTVPPPHTGRLQPAISCIRCHNQKRGETEPEGWLDLTNDVQTLLKIRLDVFGEKGNGFPDQDTLDRLAGLYAGDLAKPMRRARDDFAEAMLRLTGNPGDETASAVTVAHQSLVKSYHAYWYDLVTPEVACRELGFAVDSSDAGIILLKKLLPPLAPDGLGISPEDARLGALKAGVPINRLQWEAVYADAAARTIHTLLEQGKP